MVGPTSLAPAVFLTLVAAVFSAPTNKYEMFDGHKVLRIIPKTVKHLERLQEVQHNGLMVDYWMEPRKVGKPVDVRISPENLETFKDYLKTHGMTYETRHENLRTLIERELKELKERKPFNAGDHPNMITLNHYHTYDDIINYLNSVATQYPNLVSTVNIGSSHENRQQLGIKVGNPGSNKPAVWIDGGIHAREWITPATVIYIINELTTKQSSYASLLNAIDIYLLPVVNPDGYSYTFETNRMWRKTRSGPRSGCYGADPNRNFDYQWMVAGTSSNPCSETYGGPSAFSEIESSNLANFLRQNKDTIKSYFNLHSYSEDWVYPYGYADGVYPSDVNKLHAVSSEAVDAIERVNGERFAYGSITDVIYPASGNTIDYTKGSLNIDYSFTMELRPNQNSWDGFQLPASQIIAGASEAWAGIQVVLNRVASGQ